jgi:hypothetical protein
MCVCAYPLWCGVAVGVVLITRQKARVTAHPQLHQTTDVLRRRHRLHSHHTHRIEPHSTWVRHRSLHRGKGEEACVRCAYGGYRNSIQA